MSYNAFSGWKTNGKISVINVLPTKNLPSGYDEAPFTVGDPFHFYFGLKKGASAMDKFRIKYVNTEEIIE